MSAEISSNLDFQISRLLSIACLLLISFSAAFADDSKLELVDMRGNRHQLNETLGSDRRVALAFWQSWCSKCKHELPELSKVAKDYRNELEVIGVVSGADGDIDENKVWQVIENLDLSFPQVRDRSLDLAKRFKVKATPTIVVLGSNQSVLYQGNSLPDNWEQFFQKKNTVVSVPKLVIRERKLVAMGTDLLIKALGEDAKEIDNAIDAAIKEFIRVEDLMTDWRQSELTKLNQSAGQGPGIVPTELAAIIARSKEVSKLTAGAFDVTYASVGRLWDFKKAPPQIPSASEVKTALKLVDSSAILIEQKSSNPLTFTVELPQGMSVGLGGIAKGYGVDRAMAVLMKKGIKHASVNAGGDMKLLGQKFGKPWEVAVKHPRDKEHALAVLRLSNTSVVTSGDYERYFEVDGKRYHHIIDPRTGYPSEGTLSTTVVAQNTEYADAIATGVSVLGIEEGIKLVERLKNVEAIVVGREGEIRASSGLRNSLSK